MDDETIKALFFSRSETALRELDLKYGNTCRRIAGSILHDPHDAEECVDDAYLALWDHIPPADPDSLAGYLFRTVRNTSISRRRAKHAGKRDSDYDVALDELAETLASPGSVEEAVRANELAEALDDFLASLPKDRRILFMRRYWYSETVAEIARKSGLSETNVSVRLHRIRKRLRAYLKEKGVYDHES